MGSSGRGASGVDGLLASAVAERNKLEPISLHAPSSSGHAPSSSGASGAIPAQTGGPNQATPVAETSHVDLCPLGGGGTRWYLCGEHGPGLVFQAGCGRVDSVANSCPLCGRLCRPFVGCACEYALHPLHREARPGRRIRLRSETADQA